MSAARVATRATAPVPGSRHRDDGAPAWAFLGQGCDVRCARCGVAGVVRYSGEPRGRWCAAFLCGGCGLQLRELPVRRREGAIVPGGDWFGAACAVGRRNCGFCGERGLAHCRPIAPARVPAPEARHGPRQAAVRCPHCGHASPVTLVLVPCEDHVLGSEPATGMRLARSEALAPGKTVWAYNATHQAELARFVAAGLREGTVVANGSLASRLPAWLKSARNRRKVLAALARIDRRMASNRE